MLLGVNYSTAGIFGFIQTTSTQGRSRWGWSGAERLCHHGIGSDVQGAAHVGIASSRDMSGIILLIRRLQTGSW